MSEQDSTLNMGSEVTSPADSSQASGNFDAYIPTMPEEETVEATPAEAQNTVEAEAGSKEQVKEDAQQAVESEAAKAEDAESDKPEPFHKHPRFQELIKRNNVSP